MFEGDRRFDILVRLPESLRNDLEGMKRLPIPLPRSANGTEAKTNFIPLGEVATFELAPGPNQVSRENGKRRIVVSTNVRGRDVGSFVAEAEKGLAQIKIPTGYWTSWGGTFENLQSATQRLQIVVPVSLLLVFVLLFAMFGNVKDGLLVFTGIPFALTGGILALWLRDIPMSISAAVGFIALSGVADALRSDIISLHNGTFKASNGQALTVYALALAMRTGLNTTPMLDLKRDCLKPHPFMPRMRLIEAFKGRGNATQVKALRYTRSVEVPTSIPMDGVALFEHLLKRTEPLVANAPPELKDSVWLYQAQAKAHWGTLTKLDGSVLGYNIAGFVSRHGLLGDNGKRLALNPSRLRKTMENRLWRLSKGDLFTVAAIMGHDPKVAEQSYLAVTDEMRSNAVFVGEALPDTYRSAKDAGQPPLERTPTGRCKDSLHGDKAPRDGTHCTDFLSCFGCRSYAVIGTSEDLHRLFSFYWFLEAEGKNTRSREWAEHFTFIRTQIDLFTLDKFDEDLVIQAREAARKAPLKFWSQYRHVISRGAHV